MFPLSRTTGSNCVSTKWEREICLQILFQILRTVVEAIRTSVTSCQFRKKKHCYLLNFLLNVFCVGVFLPACIYLYYVCSWGLGRSEEVRSAGTRVTDFLVSSHVGAGNWTRVLCKSNKLSLQPILCLTSPCMPWPAHAHIQRKACNKHPLLRTTLLTVWVPGLKPWVLVLAASTFTHWALSPAPVRV